MSEPSEDLVTRCRCSPSARSRPACGPKRSAEFVGQPKVREQLQLVLEIGAAPQPAARSRAAVRAAGAGQDQPGDDRRRRARRADPGHQRPGDRARRRPRRAAHQPHRGRGAVHRRDPPHRAAGRGTALHGDGGLPGRRHRGQGARRHGDPARARPVHPRRRHHPGRPADRAAARPVRVHRAHGLLRPRRARAGARTARRNCSSVDDATPTAPPRSPPARAAPRASPTGCCAGSATTPRCAPTAQVTADIAHAALAVYDVDQLGLDRLDRAVLDALVRRFGGGPVGVGTLAVAVGEEVETVEEVAEPFLVRAGLLARTPRGRVATPAAWEHLGLPGRPAHGWTHAVRRVGSRAWSGPTRRRSSCWAGCCCSASATAGGR